MAKKIRLDEITRLASLQCTQVEAAAYFGISHNGFNRLLHRDPRARAAWDRGQASGKVSLRRKQTRLSNDSALMAIFLGKQYLGQRDVVVNEQVGAGGGPIETLDVGQLNVEERKKLREYIARSTRRPATSE